MAENKRITLDWDATGLTVYCIIRRESDGFRMDDADGAFASAPADPYVSLTEDAVIKGRYELDESRTVWNDGLYTVAIYNQAGGSPAPVSDTIIGTGPAYWAIKDDLEVFLAAPAALETTSQEILAQVTGTGDRVITIHVQDGVAAPIADVLVRIGTASQDTDTSGNAVFALDDGSYDVILRKDFVVFTVPEPLTVAGDATHTYTGALFAPSVPTQPGTCVVYGNVIDIGVDPVLGATIEIKETDSSTFSNAQKIVANKETTSDASGYWQIEVIRSSGLVPLNSPYQVIIENGDGAFRRTEIITVPDANSAEYSTIIDS